MMLTPGKKYNLAVTESGAMTWNVSVLSSSFDGSNTIAIQTVRNGYAVNPNKIEHYSYLGTEFKFLTATVDGSNTFTYYGALYSLNATTITTSSGSGLMYVGGTEYTFTRSSKFNAVENLTLGGKTFATCKVTTTISRSLNSVNQGKSVLTEWHAQGYGPIKYISQDYDASNVLTNTTTAELSADTSAI